MRAEKAEANRRAAMWAALDRKRGRGWSEEEETASRPVMPVGMSSMRLSPGKLRFGEESLDGPEKPEQARRETEVEIVVEKPQAGGERGEKKEWREQPRRARRQEGHQEKGQRWKGCGGDCGQ